MVTTPWGDAGTLRERKLQPGRRLPAEDVARNQRERLFAAMVAVVAEKGYEATRVEDLLELSGVSRSAFYAHFKDKQACLVAALQDFVGPTIAGIFEAGGPPPSESDSYRAFEAFVNLIVEQGAAARMCMVEIYAAGPEAVEEIDRTIDRIQAFVSVALEQVPGRAGMPPEIIRAIVGGLRKVIHTRLYRHEEAELAELIPHMWSWIAAYVAPPEELRRPRGRASVDGGPPGGYDTADRILRALAAVVAEKGYPAMTIGDIAAKASISLSTTSPTRRRRCWPPSTAARRRCWRRRFPPSAGRPTGRTPCAAPSARCSPSAPPSPSTRRSELSTSTRPDGGCWKRETR
jgi:AcrR family transcriptional regulator